MYYGIDVHKLNCVGTAIDDQGKIVRQLHFKNIKEEIDAFAATLNTNDSVAMEACSSWYGIYSALEEKDIPIVIAHPLGLRSNIPKKKTDKVDSKLLARLLRAGLVPPVHVPSREVRQLRNLVRHRASLVKMRTQTKNMIHALLTKNCIHHELSDLYGKKGREFLEGLELGLTDKVILSSNLNLIKHLDEEIKKISEHIASLALENKYIKLLMTIRGINYYSAMVIASEIDDVTRFPTPKHLCSYAGLVPRVYQSDATLRLGSITKEGRKMLRWILVQIALIAVRPPGRLRDFYLKLKDRKGHNIAIVATARKLLVVIFWMLTRGETQSVSKK